MKDQWDDLIDSGLKGYAGEPRAGIEKRVLARIHGAGPRWRILWPVFAAATVVLVICFVNWRVPKPLPLQVEVSRSAPAVPVAASEKVYRKKPVRKQVPLPKLDVFPTPTPLTDGERALLELMRRHPGAAVEVAKQMEKRKGEEYEASGDVVDDRDREHLGAR